MRYGMLVTMLIGIGFSLLSGCMPRSYEMKSTTTATTVVEKIQTTLVSWDELNSCDSVVDASKRLDCYSALLAKLERARQADVANVANEQYYKGFIVAVQEKSCAGYKETFREANAPEYCGFKGYQVVMDVYICEICPSAKHFVRGAEKLEDYPPGWQLSIPPEGKVIHLEIDGEIVAEMTQPFSHYVVEVDFGPPDANGKRPLSGTVLRVEGEQVPCSPPDVL